MTATPLTANNLTLSNDILREIFEHCLLHRGRAEPQPNTSVAPMVLCQVCRSWRDVALATCALWSHLDYFFLIKRDRDERFFTYTPDKVRRDIECLKWWKKNQRSIPSSLSFSCLPMDHDDPDEDFNSEVAAADLKFLVEYMSSARLLHLNEVLFTYLLKQHNQSGSQLPRFRNLQTLLTDYRNRSAEDNPSELKRSQDGTFYRDLFPVFSERSPSLRRLSLRYADMFHMDASLLANWSILTHLTLINLEFFLKPWFLLLRSVPSLQWACFGVSTRSDVDSDPDYINSDTIMFPHLSELILNVELDDSFLPWWKDAPISTLLRNVYMSVLRNLSLYVEKNILTRQHITSEVYAVLTFAPKVTKLSFGPYDPFVDDHSSDDIEPLSKYAPNLTELWVQWALDNVIFDDLVDESETFVEEMFFSKDWADLSGPVNTIRKITIDLHLTKDSLHTLSLMPLEEDDEGPKPELRRSSLFHVVRDSANTVRKIRIDLRLDDRLRALSLRHIQRDRDRRKVERHKRALFRIVKDSAMSTFLQHAKDLGSGKEVVFDVLLDATNDVVRRARGRWAYDGVCNG